MKFIKCFTILVFSAVLSFYGCKDDTQKQQQNKQADPQPIDFSNPSGQTSAEPVQNTAGVYHYTCSNGCAGGSGSAGTCANCGNTLSHNTAYHANSNPTATPDPFTSPVTQQSGQNSSGQFHYTCPSGCAGGSGSAGSCSNCGSELAHNSAYHQ